MSSSVPTNSAIPGHQQQQYQQFQQRQGQMQDNQPQSGHHPAPSTQQQSSQGNVHHAPPQGANQTEIPHIDVKQLIHSIYEKGNVGYTECDEELLNIAPDFNLLNNLIKYEAMIDKMVKRKRFDLQEQFARPLQKTRQIFRMVISNDYQQIYPPDQSSDGSSAMAIEHEPQFSWNLRITGHLLQEDQNNAAYVASQKPGFSNFFSKVTVEFDRASVHNQETVLWRKSDKNESGILIRNQSSKEIIVKIGINLYHNPLKFKVDSRLAAIIGYDLCSRSTALAALWEYVKLKNLLDAENKTEINCDEPLRQIFQQDKISMGQITSKIRGLLQTPSPTQIRHQIKLSGKVEDNERMYDFLVDVDSQLGMEIMPFFSQKVVLQEKKDAQKHPFITLNQRIKDLDKKFSETLEKIKSHKFKRDSYHAYTYDPSLFIENSIIQQNIYLQMMKDTTTHLMDDPTSLAYLRDNQDLVEREIQRYLDNIDGEKGEKEFDLYQQEQLQALQSGQGNNSQYPLQQQQISHQENGIIAGSHHSIQ